MPRERSKAAKRKEYVSVSRAAWLLGRSPDTIRRYWAEGKLEGRQYQWHGVIDIELASVERLLEEAQGVR